jgi:thymidylate synthase (FAD)
MKVIQPSASVMFFKPENEMTAEQAIEWAGRKCYKSEDKITDDSAEKFIRMIRKRGHHAMLEFGYAMAHVVGDRGNSHEQVRHRLASYA